LEVKGVQDFPCGSKEKSLWFGWLESNNFPGLHFTPPDIEVLDGRELAIAVAIPSSDATSQDALNGAAAQHFEDLRAHSKPFQPSSPLSHNCARVSRPF
jgi:hypothetical protein